MNELRIGVIGANNRGTLAKRINRRNDNARIVAGVEPYPELQKQFTDEYQKEFGYSPRVYSTYQEMLDKEPLDGIFITSPDDCHAEQACAVLARQIPVYLEKPIAISIPDADRILQCACDNRTKLMLGHNMRYMKFVLKMRELIESGVIGDVKAIWCRHFISYGGDAYFRDWHADRAHSNSLLLQKGAHDIDVIHFLAGSRTAMVQGMGGLTLYDKLPRRQGPNAMAKGDITFNAKHWPPEEQTDFNPVINVEDLNMIHMKLANGVFASYEQCHYTPDACRNYTVIGTRGRIENYGDYSEKAFVQLWTKREDQFRLEGDQTFDVSPDGDDHGGADSLIVQGFLDMLRGKNTPRSTPQGARYSVATGCRAAESIRSGGALLEVPALSPELENYDFAR